MLLSANSAAVLLGIGFAVSTDRAIQNVSSVIVTDMFQSMSLAVASFGRHAPEHILSSRRNRN